jgi:hypothetical protein
MTEQMNQDYRQKMQAFHDSHRGMLQVRVLRREHMPDLFLFAAVDPDGMVVLETISQWLREMERRAKANRFLCMSCETTFHVHRLPDAFMVAMSFAESGDNAHTMITGICRRCASQSDDAVMAAAVNAVRKIYPSAYVSEPGNA